MAFPKQLSDIKLFDPFVYKARLQPAFIMLFPLVLAVVSWSNPQAKWMGTIWSLLSAAGLTFLLSNITRNKGKALEPQLYEIWGGTPTTQLLRHRGIGNPVLRERWHKKLASFLGSPMPTEAEELEDPKKADAVYEAVTKLLIGKTRDPKVFSFVYRDNVNYNFCRNLYGLRCEGLTTSALGGIVCIGGGIHALNSSTADIMPWACSAICLCLLYWWRTIGPEWVKIPAFNYAQHLLEATETVSASRKPKEEPK